MLVVVVAPGIPSAELLVEDFGGLALAIVHAGAYIAHSPGISISAYRPLFISQRQRTLEEYNKLPVTAKLDERGDTVYTTWKMCYDQLEPESRQLLGLIAYLHYDGIYQEMFKRAAENASSRTHPLPLTDLESQAHHQVTEYLTTFLGADGSWDTMRFTRVVADLIAYSLLEFDRINTAYRVHVLVHDWAMTVVPHDQELAAECTATLVSLSIDWKQDVESLGFQRQLELHVTSVLIHSSAIGMNHAYRFERVYSSTGQWGKQIELLERLYKQFKEVLGEQHPDTLTSMSNLALTYSDLGRYDDAEQLGIQVVNASKQVLGERHPDTLISMSNLASTYSQLGRYNDAEQLEIQVVNARKQVLGEQHPETLISMSNLASTYSRLGRYNEAEQLGIQVVNACKQLLGEQHPNTLTSMNNLASTYSQLGQYDNAEQLQIQVPNARKQILGEEHPSTLISMNDLAFTYSRQAQWDKVNELDLVAISIAERTLGHHHPYTQMFQKNLKNMQTTRSTT